jgi:hypothetical protein
MYTLAYIIYVYHDTDMCNMIAIVGLFERTEWGEGKRTMGVK